MSAIASFIKLPKSALDGLKTAAVPAKCLFRSPLDDYDNYLQQNGEEASNYEWSGFVLATLLIYLKANRHIDLMKSEFDELSKFLAKSRGVTCFIFTHANRQECLEKIDVDFPEQELCDYYNRFNASADVDAGKPMVDGVRAIHESLRKVDEDSIILLSIG